MKCVISVEAGPTSRTDLIVVRCSLINGGLPSSIRLRFQGHMKKAYAQISYVSRDIEDYVL
jgi:hypothetical protein